MLRRLSLSALLLLLAGLAPAEGRTTAALDGPGTDPGLLVLVDELPDGPGESEEPGESLDDDLIAGRQAGRDAHRCRALRNALGHARPRDRRPVQVRARGPPAAARPTRA